MNYTLKPSLEYITLVKIVSTLWNQHDIKALKTKFCSSLRNGDKREKWQTIEDRVMENVPNIAIRLKEKVIGLIRPMGLQILKWIECHCENYYFGLVLPNELCWTPHGTVDRKKTAEVLIKDENITISTRYRLACIYCLENDIQQLWKKIPTHIRESFCSEDQHLLVILWTFEVKGDVDNMYDLVVRRMNRVCSPYEYAFEYAACAGNKTATEYFLQKLTPREREMSLVCTAKSVANRLSNSTDLVEVLCFLFSQMDKEQQIDIIKSNSHEMLKCFLDWPLQSFFMETISHLLYSLPAWFFDRPLQKMIYKVVDGYRDFCYQDLFGEFWSKIPEDHKRYLINGCASGSLLSSLFKIKDEKNIKLIFEDATLEEKNKLIFSSRGQYIFKDLINSEEWDLVKLFISNCITSKEELMKFKETLEERNTPSSRNKLKWDKFFWILDDFACSYKKRKIEEESNDSNKKICSIKFKNNV